MSATADDYRWMARALELAERGLFTTTPNPRVGCVIVQDGEMVGEGWHHRAGEPHAEVHALAMASERARGAEGPGGLPTNTMAHLSAALQQEPIEQRWPMTFNVLIDEALVAARPDLDLIDPDRVPASCQETLLAALERQREQAPTPP